MVNKEMINLTSATCVVNERNPLMSHEVHTIQRINEFSKPGEYIELFLGEDGMISWRDVDGRTLPIDIQYRPNSGTLTVRVPHNIIVSVEMLSKL